MATFLTTVSMITSGFTRYDARRFALLHDYTAQTIALNTPVLYMLGRF